MCKSHARRIIPAPARHSQACPSFSKLIVVALTASSFLFNQVAPGVDARLVKRHGSGGDSLRPGFDYPPCEEDEEDHSGHNHKIRAVVEAADGHSDHSHQAVPRSSVNDAWSKYGSAGIDGRPRSFVARAVVERGPKARQGDHDGHDHGDHDGHNHDEKCGTVNQAALDAYCNDALDEPYDLGLHIGAVFIQIAVSFLGTMVPLIGLWVPALKMSDYVFSWFKNFGTGVILSTGWVHMFVPGMQSLTSPCLSDGWLSYSAWAAVFAMIAMFFTQFIQTMAMQHLKAYLEDDKPVDSAALDMDTKEKANYQNLSSPANVEAATQELTAHANAHQQATTSSHAHGHDHGHHMHESADENHVHSVLLSGDSKMTKRHITVYILEAGIATHSLIIGLALGVARGDEVVPLIIALAFHQFFEGMALSTTVLDAGFKTMFQPLFMVCFYSLTTPIGIAIGIGIAQSHNANAEATLLSMGIIESIAAGILIYDATVNLLTPQITNNPKFMKMDGWHKAGIFIALWLGAAVMTIIGIWA